MGIVLFILIDEERSSPVCGVPFFGLDSVLYKNRAKHGKHVPVLFAVDCGLV